jgi:uncharacterized membrane protein YeiH
VAQVSQLPGAARPERLLFAADIAGTLVFAVEGAMAAVNGNLDLVGIMTLAIVLSAAVLVFFLHAGVRAVPILYIQVLDAAGLAIFAIAGTEKALLHKMNPLIAVLLAQAPV